jgi:hypothetical protein
MDHCAIYGVAQDEHKADFLGELVCLCENESRTLLVGGDFTIMRRKEDKNNDNFNPQWPFIFNDIIECLDLRELVLGGPRLLDSGDQAHSGNKPLFPSSYLGLSMKASTS